MGRSGGPNISVSGQILVLNLFFVVLTSRYYVASSRLDVEGAGSPCYEVDADGKEDLNKPQVSNDPRDQIG